MKQLFSILLLAIWFFTAASCKKDENNNSNGGGGSNTQTYTPPYIPPSTPGVIQTSMGFLTLKKGSSKNITATLYESDGTKNMVQPTFVWSSSDPSVASTNSGIILALEIGSTLVKVTDGSHGFAFINVEVVADTSTISIDAAQIVFEPPVLLLNTSQTKSFTYKIYDKAGNITGGSPLFTASTGSDLVVSGTSVTGGSKQGIFNIQASLNGMMIGNLQALVSLSTGSPKDTLYSVVYKAIPYHFSRPDVSSNPIIAEVTKFVVPGLNAFVEKYQTSPDQITVDANVLNMSGNGGLKAVNSGKAKVDLHYKTSEVFSYTSYVLFDLAGCWGGIVNGIQCNITFNKPTFDIWYLGGAIDGNGINLWPPYIRNTGSFTAANDGFPAGKKGYANAMGGYEVNWSYGKLSNGQITGVDLKGTKVWGLGIATHESENSLLFQSGGTGYSFERGKCIGEQIFQNTYSQFAATTSKSGKCGLDYTATLLKATISGGADSILIKGTFNQYEAYQNSGCYETGGNFMVTVPITSNTNGIYSGSVTYEPFFDVFLFTVSNGKISTTGTQLTADITVTSSGWNTITKSVTLNK